MASLISMVQGTQDTASLVCIWWAQRLRRCSGADQLQHYVPQCLSSAFSPSLCRLLLCLPQETLYPEHLLQDRSQNRVSRWKRWISLAVMPSRGQTAPRGDAATHRKSWYLTPSRWESQRLSQPCLYIYFSQVLWQWLCTAITLLLPQ